MGAIFIKGSGGGSGTNVQYLQTIAYGNGDRTYTFTESHKKVLFTVGAYGNQGTSGDFTMNSTGWTLASTYRSGSYMSHVYEKENVQANEVLSFHSAAYGGYSIIAID